MPIYDAAAVSVALDIEYRQLDNILSRNDIPGVERKTRGVTRRITLDAAVTIHIGCELASRLRVPLAHALELARAIERSGHIAIGNFATLSVDVDALRHSTLRRLDLAVEAVGRRRRGRPRGRASTTA